MVAGLSGPSCLGSVAPAVRVCTCGSVPQSRAAAAAAAAPPLGVDEVIENSVLDLGMVDWDKVLYFPSHETVTSCDVEGPHCAVSVSAWNEGCT